MSIARLTELRPKPNTRDCSSSWDAWGGGIPVGKSPRSPDCFLQPGDVSLVNKRLLGQSWPLEGSIESGLHGALGLVYCQVSKSTGVCFWRAGGPCGTELGRDSPFSDSERCVLFQRDSIVRRLQMQTLGPACLYLKPALSFIGSVTLGKFKLSVPQFLHGADKKTK